MTEPRVIASEARQSKATAWIAPPRCARGQGPGLAM